MDLPSSVEDEIAEIRKNYPKVNIKTSTKSFMIASYQRTQFTALTLTLTFPEGYPDHSLIIDINSDKIIPPGLKKKLEHDLAADLPLGHHQQVITVITRLVQFINHNKFVPCWRELKQCLSAVKSQNQHEDSSSAPKSSIKIFEGQGKIILKLHQGLYFYHCSIIVNDGYPSTTTHEEWGNACKLKMDKTNFPPKIEHMLTSQAKEVVRRMQDGMTSQMAADMSNPVNRPKNIENEKTKEVKVRLTGEKLKNLKKDVDTLSVVRDLREINTTRIQGNATVMARASKMKKEARRAVSKITNNELQKDKLEESNEWEEEEKRRLAQYDMKDGNPQPNLLALVKFLIDKIQRLPLQICPCCKSSTLPKEPSKLKALYTPSSECKTAAQKKARKEARAFRPIRCYCGCWYHHDCLNTYMTEPPFGASCPTPGCERRVYHPDWPSDIKQLERAWASHQARLREIDDAAMFL